MQTKTVSSPPTDRKNVTKRQLHFYVFLCVGVFLACVATFPLAYLRVSNSEPYQGSPFKSLTWEESQKTRPLN